jgi:hypothetical protein
LRGFLIKKQGFAIGNRDKTAPYFKQRTHFDRYVGEIILTNPLILPNASRSDLEYSEYSTMFFELLANEIAPFYNQFSSKYQEQEIANEQISALKDFLKTLNVKYKRDERDTKVLVDYIVELNNEKNKVNDKVQNSSLTNEQRESFKELISSVDLFIEEIQASIDSISSQKSKKTSAKSRAQISISKKIAKVKSVESSLPDYDSLLNLLDDLDIELTDEVRLIIEIIDEKFVQGYAGSQKEYYEMMLELREAIIKNVE